MDLIKRVNAWLRDYFDACRDLRDLTYAECVDQAAKEDRALMACSHRISIAHHYRRREFLRKRAQELLTTATVNGF